MTRSDAAGSQSPVTAGSCSDQGRCSANTASMQRSLALAAGPGLSRPAGAASATVYVSEDSHPAG
jgi:hypothetical protein